MEVPMKKSLRALVVEGGGMRGVFSAGVLDAFYEKGFDPFDIYIGVSAGACNLASHLAGQHGRNYRCYSIHMLSPEFISLKKYISGGHFMDLDWFWEYMDTVEKLDVEAASTRPGKEFIIAATDIATGEAIYFKAETDLLNIMLKGSSSLPLMYRKFIEVCGIKVTDGGVADSIPVKEAYTRGAGRIMVLRSRPSGYIKKSFFEAKIFPMFFSRYPALKNALKIRENKYMEAIAFINNPPEGVEIIEIAPDTMCTGRTSRDKAKIDQDYNRGHSAGLRAIEMWNKK
jgi:predicted patatin/cPLA2 family phospholipase